MNTTAVALTIVEKELKQKGFNVELSLDSLLVGFSGRDLSRMEIEIALGDHSDLVDITVNNGIGKLTAKS